MTTSSTAPGSPEPFNPAFLESPGSISVPMWVAASGISTAARTLVEPLIAGAMRVRGTPATLDREFLAWWLNVRRHDKGLQPALGELVSIGFLIIWDGGVHAKSNKRLKRRDPVTGKALPDLYGLRFDPPEAYQGPRNLTQAFVLFREDRDAAYRAHAENGKKGVVSINRTVFGYLPEFAQVTPTPPTEGSATPPTKGAGTDTAEFAQVTPTPPTEGSATPPTKGAGTFAQVTPTPPAKGAFKEGNFVPEGTKNEVPSFLNERDAATLRGASDAALEDDELAADIRRRAHLLPWSKSAVGRTVETLDAVDRVLVPAMVKAVRLYERAYGFTAEAAQNHALSKMPQARTVQYVADGFRAGRIPRPAPEDELPMPDLGASASKRATKSTRSEPARTSGTEEHDEVDLVDVDEFVREYGEIELRKLAVKSRLVVPCQADKQRLLSFGVSSSDILVRQSESIAQTA